MSKPILTVIFLSVLVAACGDQKAGDTEPKTDSTVNSDKPKSVTIIDAQLDALEKAKGVEQTLQEAAEKRQESMRRQGQ